MIVKPGKSKPEESTQVTEDKNKNIAKHPTQEEIYDISPEFLIKGEQERIRKREKRKKFKNLWKDHMKVLKQMDDEEKAKMDVAKRRTLELAESLEYEDEFDDLELEKQVSKPMLDITEGKIPH
jgi:hypothetical protein